MKANKKGMEIETLVWVIVIAVFLVLMGVAYVILRAKGINAIDYIKNIFRFRS